MVKSTTFRARILVGGALMLAASGLAAAQAENAEIIHQKMSHLRPLVGSWQAAYEFYNKDGTTDTEPGSLTGTWALDGTYIEVQAEHHNPDNPSRHHAYITFITYDPAAQRYVCTFFYGRSSLRVTESGVFDDPSHELRTSALIPLEDGKRDENVRETYSFADPNSVRLLHYSRYADEPVERLQLVLKLSH
jgi:uncharacterized protein DUF1579